jgi:hypothetical protein
LRGVSCVVGALNDRLIANQTLGISCRTFSAKAALLQLINGLHVLVKWTDGSRTSLVIVLPGVPGQANYIIIDVHVTLSAAKRADHYSGCTALMWDAVGEVGAAS